MRRLLLILAMATIPIASLASGSIVDAVTGKPIAGASVLAVWYYTPFGIPLPVEGSHWPQERCGGAVFVVTGKNGQYDLGARFSLRENIHRTRIWVVANDYYDDWLGPAGDDKRDFATLLSTLRWDSSHRQQDSISKRLMPFGDATIDARLLALASTRSNEYCLDQNSKAAISRFNEAANHSLGVAACRATSAGKAPRTDVFRVVFPELAYRRDIQPKLPRADRLPVPQDLVKLACQTWGTGDPGESRPLQP